MSQPLSFHEKPVWWITPGTAHTGAWSNEILGCHWWQEEGWCTSVKLIQQTMLSEHKVREDGVWKACGRKRTTQEKKRNANMAHGWIEVRKAGDSGGWGAGRCSHILAGANKTTGVLKEEPTSQWLFTPCSHRGGVHFTNWVSSTFGGMLDIDLGESKDWVIAKES